MEALSIKRGLEAWKLLHYKHRNLVRFCCFVYVLRRVCYSVHIRPITNYSCGPGSSVGVATAYGLDDPKIESQWEGGARFSTPLQTDPEAHPASCKMGTESFPGVR